MTRPSATWLFLLSGALFFSSSALASENSTRLLSFEDRVRAQEAIERVYYRHQIGTTEAFHKAVPRQVLEAKVIKYLKQSAALETFWKTPITSTMLRREIERMARGTRMPQRLGELRAALGHDPFLMAECLARATLADRLSRSFFAYDQVIHATARQQAEALHHELASGAIDPRSVRSWRQVLNATVEELALRKGEAAGHDAIRAGARSGNAGMKVLDLSPEDFHAWRARLPLQEDSIPPVEEARDGFFLRILLSETNDELQVVRFAVAKMTWDVWWDRVAGDLDHRTVTAVSVENEFMPLPGVFSSQGEDGSRESILESLGAEASMSCTGDLWDNGMAGDVPDARWGLSAVWTGSLMIIWGGEEVADDDPDGPVNSGSRYDPATDTWTPTSISGAPAGVDDHAAVWAGGRMIVWGGRLGNLSYVNSGGRYDPITDTWEATSTTGAPSPRSGNAVSTGSLMIVWGGYDGSWLNTGGRYDPATDTWMTISATGAPAALGGFSTVWTGSLMIAWGGSDSMNLGGRYDPATDTWADVSTAGAPSARKDHGAVWAENLMVVWGGTARFGLHLNTGGRYDPGTDTWASVSTAGAPPAATGNSVVWVGNRVVVWGGLIPNSDYLNTGGRYDPATDTWLPTSTTGAPVARNLHTAVGAGNLMVIWGGRDGSGSMNTGGRYNPATDTWTPTSTLVGPLKRYSHTAVWTGSRMIVWGGSNSLAFVPISSSLYDPATDAWTSSSTIGAPSRRLNHTALWTGTRMVIWGGLGTAAGAGLLNIGDRYNPITDTWTPTSTTGAPVGRYRHRAVWTGARMLVWGGLGDGGILDSGGRYDPGTDTWESMSMTGAPAGRLDHAAVWAGSRMVIWGGYDGAFMDTGGRYDPATDIWTPMSVAGAPPPRIPSRPVWTGDLMIIWGGFGGTPLASGGLYDPVTDLWTSTPTDEAPSGRSGHSIIWTGQSMVVWGGTDDADYLKSGGRYDLATNTWTPTSLMGAPAQRAAHTAVWTGSLMIVWGGGADVMADGSFELSTGGRYIPVLSAVDLDGDGHGACTGDCDDGNADIYPNAPEICDGLDNQCPGDPGHGEIDEGMPDSDGDMVVDCTDNCLSIANPGQFDDDGDGAGNACDCAPGEAAVFEPPHAIDLVEIFSAGTVQWAPDSPGASVLYDVVRGLVSALPVGSGPSEICLVSATSVTEAPDPDVPPPGEAYYYLVRGRNSCAIGTYSLDTSGVERTTSACP